MLSVLTETCSLVPNTVVGPCHCLPEQGFYSRVAGLLPEVMSEVDGLELHQVEGALVNAALKWPLSPLCPGS